MIPRADWVLADLARVLMEEVAPHTPAYQKAVLTKAAVMLGASAAAWDNAAHMLVKENRELLALFRDAAAVVDDPALAQRLREAQGCDDDLRVSVLQQTNETLRATLIVLHERIEAIDGDPARGIEAALWRELSEATSRRRTPYDAF